MFYVYNLSVFLCQIHGCTRLKTEVKSSMPTFFKERNIGESGEVEEMKSKQPFSRKVVTDV